MIAALVRGPIVTFGTITALLLAVTPVAAETDVAALERAGEAAQSRSFSGELLWVSWTGEEPYVVTTSVRSARGEPTRFGEASAPAPGRAPVPIELAGLDEALLQEKYDVVDGGEEQLLDRRCDVVEVRHKGEATLRERIWLDEETGLVLRRETYDGDGTRQRLATYLALDLAAAGTNPDSSLLDIEDAGAEESKRMPVDAAGLEALREAGWVVPEPLPAGYHPRGAYALAVADTQPLQVVYRDGLYTVSVFQQRGSADWSSLPPGAEEADLDFHAYDWPGAVPRRLVWESEGTTFTLVGDAPAEEFERIAKALPRPRQPGVLERLVRGLSRLWERMSL